MKDQQARKDIEQLKQNRESYWIKLTKLEHRVDELERRTKILAADQSMFGEYVSKRTVMERILEHLNLKPTYHRETITLEQKEDET
jgi:hypothetical protein